MWQEILWQTSSIHVERVCSRSFSGKGEFGEVLLAKVKTSEDEEETAVLVKSLQAKDEQVQSDFRKECEMFAKLSHQNITRLLGVCREAEPYYMILEYTDMVSHSSASMQCWEIALNI